MHWSEHAQCIGPCYVHEMAYQTGRSLKHGYVIQYSELCKVRDKGQRKGHRSWIITQISPVKWLKRIRVR